MSSYHNWWHFQEAANGEPDNYISGWSDGFSEEIVPSELILSHCCYIDSRLSHEKLWQSEYSDFIDSFLSV